MNINDRIKILVEGKTLDEFASLISGDNFTLDKSDLSKYIRGKVKPTTNFYTVLAKKLDVNLNWLLTGEGNVYTHEPMSNLSKLQIPIYGTVQCGQPVSRWEENGITGYVTYPNADKHKNSFALKTKGDSMSPYINEGDILICINGDTEIKDGNLVVVVFKTIGSVEANAKLIKFLKDKTVMLYPINTKHEIQYYKQSDIYKIYKVVSIIRDVIHF